MIRIQQELAQLQAEFVQLIDRWNDLCQAAQKKAWATYTQSLDEGTSGYHPFGRLLLNAWCDGWSAIGGIHLDSKGSLGPAIKDGGLGEGLRLPFSRRTLVRLDEPRLRPSDWPCSG